MSKPEKLDPTGLGARGKAWHDRSGGVTESYVQLHTIADRKVKVTKADGTEGEAMLSQVQAKLLTDADVPFSYALGETVRSVNDAAIDARRKAGMPDLCEKEDCTRELGMSPISVRLRMLRPHPWVCQDCARKSKHKGPRPVYCDGCGGADVSISAMAGRRQRKNRGEKVLCQPCAARTRLGLPTVFGQDFCGWCRVPLANTNNARLSRRKTHGAGPYPCLSCAKKRKTATQIADALDMARSTVSVGLKMKRNRV